MNKTLYIMRSVRYALRIIIILAIAFVVMALTGTLKGGIEGLVGTLFMSSNGAVLLLALTLLAVAYPYFAFATVTVRGDIGADREAVTEAFRSFGYSPAGILGNKMVFRADSIKKRLTSQWDDAITVWGEGDYIFMEGLKKNIARVELRLSSLLDKEQDSGL